MTWQFFDPATLELAGRSYAGPAAALAANTPAGLVPVLVPELLDPRRHVVRWVTDDHGEQLAVVDARAPARPPDTELVAWQWHDGLDDWLATPTVAALARDARAERARLLAACDWVVARATEAGQPVPELWRAYRTELRDVPEQSGFPDAINWPIPPAA